MSEPLMALCTSSKMQPIRDLISKVAGTNTTVLLRGESGTGKEVLARALHKASPRVGKQFLKVNCAALPGELLESELFGHEKGAFTGAYRQKPGKFEAAHQGTLLLDEIGEMPLRLQAKLLHVLQDGEFSRVGGEKIIGTDVRLIASTNRDLETAMRAHQFREDLYYSLIARSAVHHILGLPWSEARNDLTRSQAAKVGENQLGVRLQKWVRGIYEHSAAAVGQTRTRNTCWP